MGIVDDDSVKKQHEAAEGLGSSTKSAAPTAFHIAYDLVYDLASSSKVTVSSPESTNAAI